MPFLLHTEESSIFMMLYASNDSSNVLNVLNLRKDLDTKTHKLKHMWHTVTPLCGEKSDN